MNNKVELLAPAGDLNRGKLAFDFGADAIYFGAQQYSLRARASNFNFDNIKEISEYAHSRNRKIFLVTNILCHNHMIGGFNEFLDEVIKYSPDAFICSDPFIIKTIHERFPDKQIHISTQQSITNSKAALFWARNGASRIILAREVSYDELVPLIKNVNKKIDIETFIHGAVCISYSGKCMLSNNFCYRDANVGGCAQSCRWSVDLLDSNKNLIAKNFTMSAKDMCLYKYTSKLIDAGVKSFKIEGRMKSEHYIATVVNAYRKTINAIYNNVNISDEYEIDLSKAANRETDIAWYGGNPSVEKMLYHEDLKQVNQIFAFSIENKINNNTYKVLSRNHFTITNEFEIISPNLLHIEKIKLTKILDKDNVPIEIAKTPMSRLIISFDRDVDLLPNDIVRIV